MERVRVEVTAKVRSTQWIEFIVEDGADFFQRREEYVLSLLKGLGPGVDWSTLRVVVTELDDVEIRSRSYGG